MIKLERGEKPYILTNKLCDDLTKQYKQTKKDVWNSSKVKDPLKKALMDMTWHKCAYCECEIGVESKDVTIDHFLSKSKYPDRVMQWENLFPTCLRCNRQKNNDTSQIVNPCIDNPKEYIGVCLHNTYRFKGIDKNEIGKNTIRVIGLNDYERVLIPRQKQWEELEGYLKWIYEDFEEDNNIKKCSKRLKIIMKKCTSHNAYSAIKSTHILLDKNYQSIKKCLQSHHEWTSDFMSIEDELKRISLIVS